LKDLSIWEKILISLKFNNSISHNIFLFILYLSIVIFTIIALSYIKIKILAYNKYGEKQKKSIVFIAMLTFWMVVFPLGLFLIIDVSMMNEGSAAALDKALIYEINGHSVLTLL